MARKNSRSLYDPTDIENIKFLRLGKSLKKQGAKKGDVYEDEYGRLGVIL